MVRDEQKFARQGCLSSAELPKSAPPLATGFLLNALSFSHPLHISEIMKYRDERNRHYQMVDDCSVADYYDRGVAGQRWGHVKGLAA